MTLCPGYLSLLWAWSCLIVFYECCPVAWQRPMLVTSYMPVKGRSQIRMLVDLTELVKCLDNTLHVNTLHMSLQEARRRLGLQ